MKVICVAADSGKILWEQVAYEGTVFEIDPVAPADAYASLCQHGSRPGKLATVASFHTELAADPH